MIDLDEAQTLSQLINFLRVKGASTRPEVSRAIGLSRTLVTKFVALAIKQGLIIEGELGTSTGGRVPRLVEFNKENGYLLLAELGATGFSVASADLLGNLGDAIEIAIDIAVNDASTVAPLQGRGQVQHRQRKGRTAPGSHGRIDEQYAVLLHCTVALISRPGSPICAASKGAATDIAKNLLRPSTWTRTQSARLAKACA